MFYVNNSGTSLDERIRFSGSPSLCSITAFYCLLFFFQFILHSRLINWLDLTSPDCGVKN